MTQDRKIYYRSGYKYQLAQDYHLETNIRILEPIKTDWIELDCAGHMTIKHGYAWNGASGPTVDTKSSMRASCGHDAKAQLMQLGLIDWQWVGTANLEFYEDCTNDNMLHIRASIWYYALRDFGKDFMQSEKDTIYEAP